MTSKYFDSIPAELWASHMFVMDSMSPSEQKKYIKMIDEQYEASLSKVQEKEQEPAKNFLCTTKQIPTAAASSRPSSISSLDTAYNKSQNISTYPTSLFKTGSAASLNTLYNRIELKSETAETKPSVQERIESSVAGQPAGYQVVLIREAFTDEEIHEMNAMYYSGRYR